MPTSPVLPASKNSTRRKRRPPRVLMLLENNCYPDDVRVRLEAQALREAGIQVLMISPTGGSKRWSEVVDGVITYRYPAPWELGGAVGYIYEYGYSVLATFLISLYVFLRHGFDVVHSHTPPDLYAPIGWFYQRLGKKYVHDHHDLSPELYQAKRGDERRNLAYRALLAAERFACRTADRLIATNESQRRIQVERCGVRPDRCHVVRNGPSQRFLNPTHPLPALVESGRLVIGYVGLIGIQDGVDYFVRMLHRIKTDYGRRDFLGVVVGDGPALKDLQRLAEDLQLSSDELRFVGYQRGDALLQHLASFDICVTPDPSNSYNDSCTTIKTMEYMAMSKPVLAFDLPENRYTAGPAALYARANDEAELAQLLVRLMDDPAERERMGRYGRERIETEFAWTYQKQELIDLYQELLELPTAAPTTPSLNPSRSVRTTTEYRN